MEKWQEKIIKEIYEVDFIKDKKIIQTSFAELCKPLQNLTNYKYDNKPKFEGVVKNDYDSIILSFEVGNEGYQLDLYNKSIKLIAGPKTGGYVNNVPMVQPVCIVEYSIQDEKKQVYKVEIVDEQKYKSIIKCDTIQSEYNIKRDYNNLVFDKEIYKKIITNLMDIAITGTFEGECIVEDYTMDGPFM